MQFMKFLATFVFILCTFARVTFAEINAADSIEWQTIDSALVVRGVVVDLKAQKGPGQVVYFDATIQVTETLKGPAQPSVHVGIRQLLTPNPESWRASKTDLVLFLVDGKRGAAEDPELARFPYVLRPVHGSGSNALELGKTPAFTSNFTVITKDSDVLPAIRAAAKSKVTTSKRVDVPWNTEAMKALYSGSTVWLFVPSDGKLEVQTKKP